MNQFLGNAAEGFPEPFRLLVREESPSTNDELQELARQGAPHGLILAARSQTSGRGRRGNVWHSKPGDSLTLSILVRPEEPKTFWPRLALASGVAIAETIESYGIEAGIKWPNDVWIGHRKVAGILVEAGESHVIVGMGINGNTTDFPPEISSIATSLKIAFGETIDLPDLLMRLIQRIAVRHRQIGGDFADLVAAIRQRCVLTDRQVSLQTMTESLTGTVLGISDSGALLVQDAQKLHQIIQADQVRILNHS